MTRQERTREWACAVMAALSLMVAFAGWPTFKAIVDALRIVLPKVPEVVLWASLYTISATLVIAAGKAISWSIRRIEARKYRANLADLAKVVEMLGGLVDTVSGELQRETEYEQSGLLKLGEVTGKADSGIHRLVFSPLLGRTEDFAPDIVALLVSAAHHNSDEVRGAISEPVNDSAAAVRMKVQKALWGTACVKKLIDQVEEKIYKHPYAPTRDATKATPKVGAGASSP